MSHQCPFHSLLLTFQSPFQFPHYRPLNPISSLPSAHFHLHIPVPSTSSLRSRFPNFISLFLSPQSHLLVPVFPFLFPYSHPLISLYPSRFPILVSLFLSPYFCLPFFHFAFSCSQSHSPISSRSRLPIFFSPLSSLFPSPSTH